MNTARRVTSVNFTDISVAVTYPSMLYLRVPSQ